MLPLDRGAGPKGACSTKKLARLAFAAFLILLLSKAELSAGGDDGPMARAPLPPPLPAAPSEISWQPPQSGAQSPAPRRELPRSHLRAERGTPVAHLHKRSHDPHHLDRATLLARGEKRRRRRAAGDVEPGEAYPDPQVASTMIPPFAPPPSPFGYNPSAPPAYGYAPVYPPPWPPGPALPR